MADDALFVLGRDSATMIHVRDAVDADLPAVAAIYTHFTLRTTTTFNTHVRTPAEWKTRYAERAAGGHMLLVAVIDDAVVGYVETGGFRTHSGYARTCEVSIYVAPDTGGSGVGSALYDHLFERLRATDLHRAIAIVALPNESSCRFHERHGFVRRGTLQQVGYKFGKWLDTAYYERDLS